MAQLNWFGLENFRVFKEKQWFTFAPITILTGTNSSGKSSLINAIRMIGENFRYKEIAEGDEFTMESLFEVEFDIKKLIERYGGLQQFITKGSASNSFTFGFITQMHKSEDIIEVYYTIGLQNNILKTGKLVEIKMHSVNENKIIFEISRSEITVDLNEDKEAKEELKENKYGLTRPEYENYYYSSKIDLQYFYREFTKAISRSTQFFKELNIVQNQIKNYDEKDKEALSLIKENLKKINKNFNSDYQLYTNKKNISLLHENDFSPIGHRSLLVYEDWDEFKPLNKQHELNEGLFDFSYLWSIDKKYESEFKKLLDNYYGFGVENTKERLTQDILLFLSAIEWNDPKRRMSGFVNEPIIYLKPLKKATVRKNNVISRFSTSSLFSSFSFLSLIDRYILRDINKEFTFDKEGFTWDKYEDKIIDGLSSWKFDNYKEQALFNKLIKPLILLIIKVHLIINNKSSPGN